jgi:hypothetical protein
MGCASLGCVAEVTDRECPTIPPGPRAQEIQFGHYAGCTLNQLPAADVFELLSDRSYPLRTAARAELERRGLLWRRKWRKEL